MNEKKENSQILIISHVSSFTHLVKVSLDLSFNYDFTTCKTSNEALNQLPYIKNLDSIIYLQKAKDFSFADVAHWVEKNGKCKVLFVAENPSSVSEEFKNSPFIAIAPKDFFIKEFNQFMTKFFQIEDDDHEYRKVEIDSLTKIDGIPNDLYIEMSNKKFVQITSSKSHFGKEDIQRLKAQKINEVYIRKELASEIVSKVSKQADFFINHPGFKFVYRSPDDPLAKRFEQKILRCNEDFLIDQEFQKQLETVITKTTDNLQKIPKLQTLLKTIEEKREDNNDNYLAEHMILLAYVTSAWATLLGWHSKGTQEKLVFASVLHDITLGGMPYLAKIKNLYHFKQVQAQLSKTEQEIFLRHPLETAHLVSSFFQLAPPDTEVIIRQHHELPDGKGFPKGINWSKMTPLSALFIVAHDYVDELLIGQKPKEAIADSLASKYPQQIFQSILKVFKQMEEEIT